MGVAAPDPAPTMPCPGPLPTPQHYLGALVAGMSAGTASSLIRVPTEVVKQRLQTGEYKGAVTAVRITLRSAWAVHAGLHGACQCATGTRCGPH